MKNILVIDSGAGAVSVAKEIAKNIDANFYIYIDNKNSPYGCKTTNELNELAERIVEKCLKKYKIDLVVLACNTLSASSLSFLRGRYTIPFVGTEPNIKVKEIPFVVIATEYTVRHCKLLKNATFDVVATPNLATYIDKNLLNFKSLKKYIEKNCSFLSKYMAVSLGCTHYSFVADLIGDLYPNLVIYENKVGVARRVANLLCGSKSYNSVSSYTFMFSKRCKNYENKIRLLLKL